MNKQAAEAYAKNAAEFLALAEKILEAAKAAQEVPAAVNWGHVGDYAKTNADLRDVCEWLRV